jgi:hypothetical protein
MRLLSAVLTLAIFSGVCSCSRPDDARTILDHPGTFHCFDRQMVVTVWEASTNSLNYTVSRKQSKVGPSLPPLRKGSQWVIYPETPDSIWIYDGTKDVTHVEFGANGGTKFTSSQVVPSILKAAPPVFLQRLPKHENGSAARTPENGIVEARR